MNDKEPEEARTTPLGLWSYAKDFSEAADIILEKKGESALFPPLYYLYGHSIELALKAFLRTRGRSLDDLKKLGHDIGKIYPKAMEAGLSAEVSLTTGQAEALELFSSYYMNKEFEYIKTGYKKLPTTSVLRDAADALVSGLKRLCEISTLEQKF